MESGTVWSEMTGTVWSEMGGTVWSVIATVRHSRIIKRQSLEDGPGLNESKFMTGLKGGLLCMPMDGKK